MGTLGFKSVVRRLPGYAAALTLCLIVTGCEAIQQLHEQDVLNVLNKLVFASDHAGPDLARRARHYAQLKERTAAHLDVADFLERAPTPALHYEAACIYALTSRQDPTDRQRALQQLRLGRSSYYPSVNLVGIFQSRASGFAQTYAQDQSRFTNSYSTGVKPTISNYLVGVGMTWNLTTIYRTNAQVKVSVK